MAGAPSFSLSSQSKSTSPSHQPPQPNKLQCHTCRKRRVRCDSGQPSCQKCMARGIECLGYGKQKPLVWLEGGGNQNQYLKESCLPARERRSRKKGRPKLRVASKEDKDTSASPSHLPDTDSVEEAEVEIEESALVRVKEAIPETMMFSYPSEIQQVVRAMWYYEYELVPDLDPINHSIRTESGDPTCWQEDLASILWNILICAVDTHKAIRSQPDDQVEIGRSVYKSKSQTFMRLNKKLADPKTQISDVTLISVLTLFLAETQLSAVGSWTTHFEGANHIIRLRGGVKTIAQQSKYLHGLLTFFMAADVLSYTTIPNALPILDAIRQLEYTELIPDVFQNGSETCIPCPNELFAAIIQINHLRAISENAIVEIGHDNGFNFKASVHALLQTILSFPIASWADQMEDRCGQHIAAATSTRLDPQKAYLRPARDDWVRLASIYHAAVALYCVRSIALDLDELLHVSFMPNQPIPTSYVTTSDILIVAKKILFNRLQEVLCAVRDPRESLAKVLIWPMFVAGVEASLDPEAGEFRALLETGLRRLCRSLGTLSISGLRTFLMELWDYTDRLDSHEMRPQWWSELLQLSSGRSIFFM
ncbi:hypothetical protein FQN49_007058 [Arthroderma sp. PD_2]|nr:hypothetical protein FQN49_007058 [Arthroderma sp. PD_2]